jgi:hypothetical protein
LPLFYAARMPPGRVVRLAATSAECLGQFSGYPELCRAVQFADNGMRIAFPPDLRRLA